MTGSLALIDIALAATAAEVALMLGYHRITGRGVAPGEFLGNLAPGLCLMVALRGGMAGAGWAWIGVCLAAAFVAHVADLRRRWR